MDNITHSLVGATLAQLFRRDTAGPSERRLCQAAAIVASNLPDADLVYTGLTPAPLGYLLHHRGHTHTLAGLLGQAALLAALCALPALRRAVAEAGPRRLSALVALGLASHLVLDAWNSYGIHPFHPFDPRWRYGDAVFIFEPWLWVLIGVPLAAGARSRWGWIARLGLLGVLPAALTVAGVLPQAALAALAVAAAALAWWLRQATPRFRAATALALSALFVTGMFGLSRAARAATRAELRREPTGQLLDVVLNPNPGWPLCFAVIAIEKDESAGRFVLSRGTLSLLPAWQAPRECPSHRLAGPSRAEDGPSPAPSGAGEAALAWSDRLAQPLAELRALAGRDCWVRAWLQFGRAPVLRGGSIADLRFDNGPRDNFTEMAVMPHRQGRECPGGMTNWGMPRADLLEPARGPGSGE